MRLPRLTVDHPRPKVGIRPESSCSPLHHSSRAQDPRLTENSQIGNSQNGRHERCRVGEHPASGATLVEVLIAASISVMVLTAFMLLVVETAKEQRWGLIETQLHAEAGVLQDRLTRLLRQMSANESTVFGDRITPGSPFFRRIVVAKGKTPAFPRQEVIYNPNDRTLVHDPNRALIGDEIPLHAAASPIKLRDFYFFSSMKPGGVPDSSSINVWLELDDDGASGRVNPDGSPRPVSVVRSFTVTMRNH